MTKSHPQNSESPFFSHILDHTRWIAAMVVMLGHTRHAFFGPFGDVVSPSPAQYVFFFFTNFQNEAVICFFVISGYLIGGRTYVEVSEGRFSARKYCIARLSRLYIVLIPALILTYGLSGHVYCMAAPWTDWLASLIFLQDILVGMPYCITPLWSLANEFWYYAIALFIALLPIHKLKMIAALMMVAALLSFDHIDRHNVFLYLPVWGLGVALIASNRIAKSWMPGPWVNGSLFLLALVVSRTHILDDWFLLRDYFVAGTLTLLLCSFRESKSARLLLPRMGYRLASVSFTLYLIHYPLLWSTKFWLEDYGWLTFPLSADTFVSFAVYLAISGIIILAAFLFGSVTEWRTNQLRQVVSRLLP